MADLQKFLFDVDFDDVELMETIVQEEVEEEKGDSEADQPGPEIMIPMFSEEDLEAARQEGFNIGKENGSTETLAGIENTISDALSRIADQISELFNRQSEFNQEITSESILLIKNVNRKLFPVMNKQGALDEVVEFSQDLLSKFLTEPRITIRVHEEIAEPLKQRVLQFLEGRNFHGDLMVSGNEDISAGSCQVEWSSGSAERNPEMLLSEIEERFLTATDNVLLAKSSNQLASSAERSQTESDTTVFDAKMKSVEQHESVNDITEITEVSGETPSISDLDEEEGSEEKQSNSKSEIEFEASSPVDPLQTESVAEVSEAERQTVEQHDGTVNDTTKSGEISSDGPPISNADDEEGSEDKQSNSE